jgi:hypothetical protein
MAQPLFKIGDLVHVQRGVSPNAVEQLLDGSLAHNRPTGVFEIMAVLPEDERGQRQYRIKGGDPAHERIASESQLVHAPKPQPRQRRRGP